MTMFLRAALILAKPTLHLEFETSIRCFGRYPVGSRCNTEFLASRRRCFDDLLPNTRHVETNAENHLAVSPYKDAELHNVGICELVWEKVKEWREKKAIVCGLTGRFYYHGQLRESCRKFGSALRKTGLAQDDVVGVILYNTPDYPVVTLGAIEAGLVLTTFNPDYTTGEIARQLLDINPRLIVTSPELWENVVEATKLATDHGYMAPVMVVTDGGEGKNIPKGALDMHQMIRSNDDFSNILNLDVNLETPAMILYTSGTTGLPKGVMLSQKNVVAAMQIQQEPSLALLEPATGKYQDVLPAVVPFFHVYGLVVVLFSALRNGCKVVTMASKFDTTVFMEVMAKYQASVLFLAPPLVLLLGSTPELTLQPFASLRYVISGASPLREADAERFLKKALPNVKLLQGYGLTETAPVVCLNRKNSKKIDSVGPCVPNTVIKVIGKNGHSLGPHEMGEVCVKGPQVMIGYNKNAEETSLAIDESGWLHTGDIGYYDKHKDFYIVDRLKDLIMVDGHRVFPNELEELLRSHGEVLNCAVVGAPDGRSGQAVYAYVTLNNVSKASDKLEQELKHFVNNKVVEYKQIKEVKFIEEIPTSRAGKTLRRLLRNKLVNKEGQKEE